ncbi:hypothetical protein B0H16DRAFT_1345302, partial [Mycena metata]
LPDIMPSLGKLRIVDGESIRSSSASGSGSHPERDMSFYVIQIRKNQTDEWRTQIFYGQLERILECVLPKEQTLGIVSGKRRLLAVIHKSTGGKDASLERTSYTGLANLLVTDLQSVVAVVGRVPTRGRWLIVDRTGGLIQPEFVQHEDTDTEYSRITQECFVHEFSVSFILCPEIHVAAPWML